jgi:hypothetical protein
MASKGRIPDNWLTWMAKEEKRTGLPEGTLSSLVKQETGFQQRFLDDPSAPHYSVGPNGEKPKSSARGLGGILEGTARQPGYGVAPLKDWSVPEQLRFMADYTVARSKQAGSLEAGLAAYGEGDGYARQVMSRLGYKPSVKQSAPAMKEQDAPVMVAQAPEAPQELPPLVYNPSVNEADLVDPHMAWNGNQVAANQPATPTAFNFWLNNPLNAEMLTKVIQPNFTAFSGWGRQRAA